MFVERRGGRGGFIERTGLCMFNERIRRGIYRKDISIYLC